MKNNATTKFGVDITFFTQLVCARYHLIQTAWSAKMAGTFLSKTEFTNEAGNCLIMQLQLAKKKATMVILNARAKSIRANHFGV
jgi:D-alanyl-D-alanine carboxypeptidase